MKLPRKSECWGEKSFEQADNEWKRIPRNFKRRKVKISQQMLFPFLQSFNIPSTPEYFENIAEQMWVGWLKVTPEVAPSSLLSRAFDEVYFSWFPQKCWRYWHMAGMMHWNDLYRKAIYSDAEVEYTHMWNNDIDRHTRQSFVKNCVCLKSVIKL